MLRKCWAFPDHFGQLADENPYTILSLVVKGPGGRYSGGMMLEKFAEVNHLSRSEKLIVHLYLALALALTLAVALLVPGCRWPSGARHSASGIVAAQTNYPAHWWTAIPRQGVPDWEILPQEAGPGEVILSKRNELGLLSNFAPTPFTFRGQRYASLEGFWQMMKYPENEADPRARFPGLQWPYTRAQVAQMTSFEAKHAGTLVEDNMKKMGIDWVTFEGRQMEYKPAKPGEHYELIVAATWAKVRQNPEVKKVLLATGDLVLRPDHHQEPDAPAAWRYYEILIQIRTALSLKK